MAILPIVEIPDPRLRLVSKPVETVDDSVRQLVSDMIETMYDAHGIGLAAIQVGVDQRILVIDLQEEEDEEGKPVKNPKAYINPEVLSVSEELSTYNEGCLSIPEQYAEVKRPASCRVKWLDEKGEAHEAELDGLLKQAGISLDNAFLAKIVASFHGALAWLDTHLAAALAELPAPRTTSVLEVSVFCLVEHLAFRATISAEPYATLRRFAETFATRPSAQRTSYRFDPKPA